ncbi:MAG: hypothetical protein GTO14_09285 [Anaerolineales bacterium]|nr:hypothetical protein [Anaerolineales bacterium]
MDVSYPVGYPAHQPGPLSRFLPPLEEGSTTRALERYGDPGDIVLDPFGASPRLSLEAARAGHPVLVAVNNPITRFVLKHTLNPFTLNELQAALARLAAAPKNDVRLEPFLLELYSSVCVRCGASVIVEHFVWDRELAGPTHKVYACERCNFVGEAAVSDADWQRAQSFAPRGLQHALALEQVAPSGDSDRVHADAALAVYPGRALYALITLVNKVNQISWIPPLHAAAQALLLSAFDAVNALWGYPEGRSRPRKLSASSRYREMNVWRALERAVGIWAMDDFQVQLTKWPQPDIPGPGGVSVFPGPVRDLISTVPHGLKPIVLSVLPRPNQAYWTLSALWAAWLWGREAAAPIKVALRRRRYDWAWHASALRTVIDRLGTSIEVDKPVLAFIPEAEPGFTAAALAGFDGAGFQLTGCALRINEGQAFFTWEDAEKAVGALSTRVIKRRMRPAAQNILQNRGEPSPFASVHAAIWCELARARQLAVMWDKEDGHPLPIVSELLEDVIADRSIFLHLGRGTEPESGLYWLVDTTGISKPLADQVEDLVLEILRTGVGLSEVEVDDRVCRELSGLLTPDQRLVHACLDSYAVEDEERGLWFLRPEDDPEARAADCQEMIRLLIELGERLGYSVKEQDPLLWSDERGSVKYIFRVLETATLGAALQADEVTPLTFVLPGGRAGLVAEKSRRDPRLREWLKSGPRVIKFRHVRRLAAEATLTMENLTERLGIDPPGHHDPQLPLL